MITLVQSFLKMFWMVVSVGVSGVLLLHVNLLSLGSHDEHRHGNLLRLASHDELLGVLLLGLVPCNVTLANLFLDSSFLFLASDLTSLSA
jgi:hypothetical protein